MTFKKHFYLASQYKSANSAYIFSSDDGYELSELVKEDNKGKYPSIIFPVVVDTEYVAVPHKPRKRLTSQITTIMNPLDNAVIYDDWDSCIDKEKRCFERPSDDEIYISFLRRFTNLDIAVYDVHHEEITPFFSKITTEESLHIDVYETLPIFIFRIYSHFAIAELFAIHRLNSTGYENLKQACTKDGLKVQDNEDLLNVRRSRLEFGRRLSCVTETDNPNHTYNKDSFIELGRVLVIDGVGYRIGISFVDTCGVRTSYSELLSAGKIDQSFKHVFTRGDDSDLSKMDEMYLTRTRDFADYSKNDLLVYEALKSVYRMDSTMKQNFNIEPFPMRLTTGSNVAGIICEMIKKQYPLLTDRIVFDRNDKKVVMSGEYLDLASAKYFSDMFENSASLLGKVHGGRCVNAQPLVSKVTGALCDLDLSGCYGEGMRSQVYPIGKPRVFNYGETGISLREFFPLVKRFAVGCWSGVINTRTILKYKQDFFQSYFDHDDSLINKLDSMNEDDYKTKRYDEFFQDYHKGHSKIFTNEIINGCLTHDAIQWIENLPVRQKNDFLDNVLVNGATGYFEDDYFSDERLLIEAHDEFLSVNSVRISDKTNDHDDGFYGWTGCTLGELCIDEFIIARKKAQFENGKGSAEDTACKLVVNTTYGVLCSPYFDVGNVIAANNITSRVRAMIWYTEKGLNSFHSITDGGVFDLNSVITSGSRKLSMTDLMNYTKAYHGKSHHRKMGLFHEKVRLSYVNNEPVLTLGDKQIIGKEVFQVVNVKAMGHLQSLFPFADVLRSETTGLSYQDGEIIRKTRIGQFEFEAKGFFTKVILHGTSNYQLYIDNTSLKVKYRSYENKKLYESLNKDMEVYSIGVNPANLLMSDIDKDINNVNISPAFVKNGIIKLGAYKEKGKRYRNHNLVVGDSEKIVGCLNPFSISQFKYRTLEQYKTIEKSVYSQKRKYGWSYERFFTSDGISIDYEMMLQTIYKMIDSDDTDIKKYLGLSVREMKRRNVLKRLDFETLKSIKDELSNPPSKNFLKN